MTRAAIYLRVSLDRTGELLAVDRQREDCERIVKARGWELAGEYVDNSISASKKDVQRPGYNALVADFQAGAFDALVTWDLDRLTRQPRQLEDWIDRASESGLKLVTANGEADLSTDAGRLFARIKAAVAREEIERKGARQKRAARQRAEGGGMASFKPCYGYTSSNEIVEPQAAVVREMFARFAAGETLYALRMWLNSTDFKPLQSETWSMTTVRGMLTNPRYAARVVYKGEVVPTPGTWTPIVEPGLFDTVQAILSDPRRKTNRTGTARKWLMSGLIECGECGRPLAGRKNSYFCTLYCLTKARPVVDEYVETIVRERLARIPAGALTKAPDADPELEAKVLALRGRLATIESDYDAGLIDGRRFAVASEKVNAELAEAERARRGRTGTAAVLSVTSAKDPAAAFDEADLSVRRAIVDTLMHVRALKGPAHTGGHFDYDLIEITWKA